MIKKIRRPWFALVALAIVVVAAVGGSAAFGNSPAPTTVATPPVTQTVPTGALSSRFGVLRSPTTNVADLSATVRNQFTSDDPAHRFGIDLASLHAAGPADHRFYVAAGPGGLCLFLPDGGSFCTADLDHIARFGLEISDVPLSTNPGTDNMRPIDPSATVTTYGIAPDNVMSVEGQTSSGDTDNTPLTDNAYVLTTRTPVKHTTFHSPSASWSN